MKVPLNAETLFPATMAVPFTGKVQVVLQVTVAVEPLPTMFVRIPPLKAVTT